MKTMNYQLEPLNCPSCIIKIKFGVKKVKGVSKVGVSLKESKVKVTYNEETTNAKNIKEAIKNLGYDVLAEEKFS